jgi:hypothetical protein
MAERVIDCAVGKGQALLCNLKAAIDGAPQSTWTDYDALTTNGWVVDEEYKPIFGMRLIQLSKNLSWIHPTTVLWQWTKPATVNGDDYKVRSF